MLDHAALILPIAGTVFVVLGILLWLRADSLLARRRIPELAAVKLRQAAVGIVMAGLCEAVVGAICALAFIAGVVAGWK